MKKVNMIFILVAIVHLIICQNIISIVLLIVSLVNGYVNRE